MVSNMASLAITLLQYLLLFRAIMSWFPQMQGGKLFELIYGLTEPVILPFRKLLQNFRGLQGIPLDISFLLAYLSLILLELLLHGLLF